MEKVIEQIYDFRKYSRKVDDFLFDMITWTMDSPALIGLQLSIVVMLFCVPVFLSVILPLRTLDIVDKVFTLTVNLTDYGINKSEDTGNKWYMVLLVAPLVVVAVTMMFTYGLVKLRRQRRDDEEVIAKKVARKHARKVKKNLKAVEMLNNRRPVSYCLDDNGDIVTEEGYSIYGYTDNQGNSKYKDFMVEATIKKHNFK